MKLTSQGFTLLELMIVIAIIGVLATSLFPSFTNYIQRGRDTARLSDIDTLSKKLTVYFTQNDMYPSSDGQGCLDDSAILTVSDGEFIHDPQPTHSNGCNTLGRYGYAMATGILTNPNVYSLVAFMEQPLGGNYVGDLSGFTGTLTATAYNTGLLYTQKGSGPYYIRVP